MSKYYKAEDIQELITACEWRMTLAKERNGEGFVDYRKQVLDVDELTKRLTGLPTIEASEDCISRKWLLSKVYDMDNDNLVVDLKDIENAPSVVPIAEQYSKVGEWKKVLADIGYCSVCNEQVKSDEFEDYRYCPNCGAKMRLE